MAVAERTEAAILEFVKDYKILMSTAHRCGYVVGQGKARERWEGEASFQEPSFSIVRVATAASSTDFERDLEFRIGQIYQELARLSDRHQTGGRDREFDKAIAAQIEQLRELQNRHAALIEKRFREAVALPPEGRKLLSDALSLLKKREDPSGRDYSTD